MEMTLKTYKAPAVRTVDFRLEHGFLQLSVADAADNKYNPENDLGGIE